MLVLSQVFVTPPTEAQRKKAQQKEAAKKMKLRTIQPSGEQPRGGRDHTGRCCGDVEMGCIGSSHAADPRALPATKPEEPKDTQDAAASKKTKKKKKRRSIFSSMAESVGYEDPDNCAWLPLARLDKDTGRTSCSGEVCVSVEILPKSLAERMSAGFGQSEPNRNPVLPPPVGRIDLTQFWNPLYVLRACFGKKMFTEICCCFLLIIFIAGSSYVVPPIHDLLDFAAYVPYHLGQWAIAIALLWLCTTICWLAQRCHVMFGPQDHDDDDDDDDNDDEDEDDEDADGA